MGLWCLARILGQLYWVQCGTIADRYVIDMWTKLAVWRRDRYLRGGPRYISLSNNITFLLLLIVHSFILSLQIMSTIK